MVVSGYSISNSVIINPKTVFLPACANPGHKWKAECSTMTYTNHQINPNIPSKLNTRVFITRILGDNKNNIINIGNTQVRKNESV